MSDHDEFMMSCLGVRVRRDVIGFFLELQDAGFEVSATGTRLFVEPAYCLSQDDRDGIAQFGTELAAFIVAAERTN